MKFISRSVVSLLLLTSATAFADDPILIFDPLPKPLKLPPGNIETLPLNKTASFFGDAMRVVDCADPDLARFGTCGNQFFGGMVMHDSHLSGNVTIQFFPTGPTTAHFTVSIGTLNGDEGVLSAPLGYPSLAVTHNTVTDALQISQGDLDLTNGYATNLKFNTNFGNTAYLALLNVNPKLVAPVFAFPGARGHAWANFSQRADGLLDFYFRGSTFLPLGADTLGDPVRFPLPFCSPFFQCASIVARGTSLHPHLYLETRQDLGLPPCAPGACPDLPTDKVQMFQVNSRYTAFGDDFELGIPQLGGTGPGRAELQGRFEIQFGAPSGGTLPFVIQAAVPEGLFSEPPANAILGPAFRGFLLGPNGKIKFPAQTYIQHRIVFANEVFNVAQGMIDLKSGRTIGEFEFPIYIGQTLIDLIFADNPGRISGDPFFVAALRPPQEPNDPLYALFEKTPTGQTMFRANLFHHRSYAGFCFPMPNYLNNQCWNTPEGGNLNIFVKLQAARLADPGSPGSAVLSDSRSFVSGIDENVTYSFNAPCDAVGRPVSLIYTNASTGTGGGTFTLKHAASVSCVNSKVSTAARGNYDTVTITGFGTWSKDPKDSVPRFISANLSVDPANPYAHIIVFQNYPGELQSIPLDDTDVILSSAENKPANKPTP